MAVTIIIEIHRYPKGARIPQNGYDEESRSASGGPAALLKRTASMARKILDAVIPRRTGSAREESRPSCELPIPLEITPAHEDAPYFSAQEKTVGNQETQHDESNREPAEIEESMPEATGETDDSLTISQEDIRQFAVALAAEELSKSTVEKYVLYVNRLAEWVGARPISKNLLVDWKRGLEEKGMNPSTQNTCIAAVNKFLAFSKREDCILKSVKTQKQDFRPESRNLSKEEYEALVEEAKRLGKERTRLILNVLAAMGIRVSELKFITVEAALKGFTEITMKGKSRTIVFPEELRIRLLDYAARQAVTSGSIFLTRTGSPVSRQQVLREMKAICEGANVDRSKVFPHNFRHLFACTYYEKYHDLAALANLLGHSNIQTTRIYLRTTAEHCARQLDELDLVA